MANSKICKNLITKTSDFTEIEFPSGTVEKELWPIRDFGLSTPTGYHVLLSQLSWNIGSNTQWFDCAFCSNPQYGFWVLRLKESNHTVSLRMKVIYEHD